METVQEDRERFDRLHRAFFDDLRRFVARRVRDLALAEDIAQETFLRAYRSRASLRANEPEWPWLIGIARHLVLNHHRQKRRRVQVELVADWDALTYWPDPDTASEPELGYASLQAQKAITAALQLLPPRQRRLLILRGAGGLSYQEIATAEGLSPDALKSALKRARQSFRAAYSAISSERDLPAVVPGLLSGLTRRATARLEQIRGKLLNHPASFMRGLSPSWANLGEAVAVLLASAVLVVSMAGVAQKRVHGGPGDSAPDRRSDASLRDIDLSVEGRQPFALVRSALRLDVAATTTIEVTGEYGDEQPDRRRLRVLVSPKLPGGDSEENWDTWVEIPCGEIGPETAVCGVGDRVNDLLGDR